MLETPIEHNHYSAYMLFASKYGLQVRISIPVQCRDTKEWS